MYWYSKTTDTVINELNTDKNKGLSESHAVKRLDDYGYNTLKAKKGKNLIMRFIAQLSDFMVIILIIAAVISFLVGFIEGKANITDPIVILVIVFTNACIGVFQEARAEKAIEELKKITAPHARVIREGKQKIIDAAFLVPGDIISLESGDFIPADARLISSVNLSTDESSLTGESLPVDKDSRLIFDNNTPVGDRKNMLMSASLVTNGRATAVVTETGMNTNVGKIADMLGEDDDSITPLQSRLNKTGKILGIVALGVCAFIFFLGIFQQMHILEMFMISISLAVAAIPEGLPATVTIILAIGVSKMARKNVIVRKLHAVETLGCATVICSDKTGTLTQNKMEVTQTNTLSNDKSSVNKTLLYGSICNNFALSDNKITGNPTDIAIATAYSKLDTAYTQTLQSFSRIREIPFSSNRKLMSVICENRGKKLVICKGAYDFLIKKCTHIEHNGAVLEINEQRITSLSAMADEMADRAMRVIAVAYKEISGSKISDENAERGLVFLGLVGITDPPRPEVRDAVVLCKRAGIKTVMITGDHLKTAQAIAEELGIYNGAVPVLGSDIDGMDDLQLRKACKNSVVFARVAPEHKARIVKAFKSLGNVVAMTGDGVNDAPALKLSDIGCAMGITGTDVSKSAADIILTDDNFTSIISAVREGRGIYQNIRRCIHFLLSSNTGEIITILTAFLLRLPTPLLPIHLLWVNLVTDSLPALALGTEPTDNDVMKQKPVNRKKSIFANGLGMSIISEGIMIGVLSLTAYHIGYHSFNLEIGRTMSFCVLSLSQLFHAFNMRSDKSIFKVGLFTNKFLLYAFAICALMQVSVVTFDVFTDIFNVASLNFNQWSIVGILSFAPIVIIEMVKRLSEQVKL